MKTVQYHITEESFQLVNKYSNELNIRKSMFVDFLIKHYAKDLKDDISTKINKYNTDCEDGQKTWEKNTINIVK